MKIWKSVIDIILKQSKTTSSHKPVPELRVEPLETRTLLASHPLADAPDVDYKITEDWNSGHTGEFSLINDEGMDFENWQIEFDYGAAIGNYWNAELESLGNGRYRLTPPSWDNTLNQGENLAVGFIAYGSTSTPSNITFNGVPAGPPDPDTDSPPDTNPTDSGTTDSGTTDSGTTDSGTSTDPAQLPTIQISGAQVVEGDAGHATATFTVTLSESSNETVTADFHTMTNSAASGIDFEQAAGTVSFAPGETTQTIDVLVKGDLLVEGDERFEVMLMNPVGGVFEGSADMHAGHGLVSGGAPGEVLSVPTEGTFSYFSDSGSNSFRIMDLTSTGAHSVQLMVNSSGDLMVIGPFNGSAIQQHETPLEQLIAGTTVSFLETRLPDPEEDPNSMISGWMQEPIGGLQISNAHLYCDAAGLFLGEKLGIVGGQSDEGFVVTSHRMDDYGRPIVNVIENFNPSSDKLDFQYFANREFAVADTPDGLLISASPQASDPWGEKTLVLGVTFSEISEDNFIFRFEQKYEDGFNRFGGTSETTHTDGSREIPFVASPLDPTNSQTIGGTTRSGEFTIAITDDWDSGYVINVTFTPEVTVGNWQVTLQTNGAIQNIWNAEILSEENGRYVIGNVDYNGNVSAGQSITFGFDAIGSSSSVQVVSDAPNDNPMPDDDMFHHDNHTGVGAISGYGTIIDNDTMPPMDDHSGHDGNDDSTTPPMDDHSDHDGHDHGTHDPMEPPATSGDYIDITSWGTFHGSNNNSEHDELVGGRTAITTEAHEAYNNLRAFLGLEPVTMEQVGEWAFSEALTNNSQAWGNDLLGVGLWYAMQGAKVGWISDEAYDPQILADIQRTARTVEDPTAMRDQVMDMVRQFGHEGYADYLEQYGIVDTFINTLKMEPHYGGWMHGRTHGFRSIEGVAINHDINHLTVLSWDQMQPFMNDTFDWPQWDALDVSDSGVIEYYQSMVSLGNPVGQNLESAPTSVAPPVTDPPTTPPVDDNGGNDDSTMPPMDDHSGHDGNDDSTTPPMDDHSDHDGHDHGTHDPMEPPATSGDYIDITSWGTFHGSNNNSEHDELVGGRTAITTEAHEAYNNLRAFLGLEPVTMEQVGEWAFSEALTNNSQAWGNDLLGVGLWYAMQGAKVGWISDEAYDPQILADIQRTARTVEDPTAMRDQVMDMVRQFGHEGYADYLEQYGIVDTFINTLKMEPHYGGWMHGRTHGFRSIEGVAINHDINHLTVLSWDQMQPFMNDTFDWPQWDALDVSDSGVIEYYQSMVSLGNPVGQNLESAPTSVAPPVTDPPTTPPVDDNSDTTDSGNTNSGTTDSGTTDTDNSVDSPKMVAYFPEWGIYGRDYHISDVPASELTHLVYAFANLTSDGQMVLFDNFAATEKRFAAGDTVTGEADLWHYPEDDPRSAQTVWGNFNQITQLKAANPHLRTSIALGGWTLSTHFSTVTSTAAGREALAQSIYDFLNTYTMFDGIDFDWEYPGGGGLGTNSVSPQDGEYYAALLELVRDKLDLLGNERGRYYEISVASPAGSDKIANFNLPGLKDNVDFFNVMTYDLHGTWENTTGHQSALRNDPVGYDIETAINLYLNAGIPQEKIILGNALYTRAWSGVADGGDNGYQEAASGSAPGTFESGTYDYKDLLGQIQSGTSDWELNWDDDAQAAYLYSASQQIFSSFETPGTISLKSEWAQDAGLGGMMFWDLSNDSSGPESLISAAANSWFDGQTFSEITSASDLVFANIYGGNGVFDLVAESATNPSNPTTNTDVIDSTDPSGNDSTNDDVFDPPTSNTNGSVLDSSVTFAKSQGWYNGFNADATLENPNSTRLTNWVLEFTFEGDITHIWNATILQRDGDRYVISGADWNRDIAGGGQVSFGFTAAGTEILSPTDIALYSTDLNNNES